MDIILVNATACRTSGALAILNQFVDNISLNGTSRYVVFVDPTVENMSQGCIVYVPVDTTHWIKRIGWDEWGMKKWCKKNNITPNLIISLQNTGVNWSEIPQLIYYHQLLTISPHNWNPLKREEFVLFCYKHFYSFFVKRYITERTHFVVQIPFIKDAFINKFKVKEKQISVLFPQIKTIDYDEVPSPEWCNDYYHFIYPATPFVYKNHIELIDAIAILATEHPDLKEKIKIHFTFDVNVKKSLHETIVKKQLDTIFIFDGSMPFEQLLSYYKDCHAMLFPSYIESLGLPLIEAAMAGVPIIAADMSYARDVIGDYEGVNFVKIHDPIGWKEAIYDCCREIKRYNRFHNTKSNGWKSFFELIDLMK